MGKVQQITPFRGEVFLVDFNPAVGSEIQKIRPALVLQNDIDNKYSPLTIVAAITSQTDMKLSPNRVSISAKDGGLHSQSLILLNQIHTVDKQRLIKRLGKVSGQTMKSVDFALKVSLGLIAL